MRQIGRGVGVCLKLETPTLGQNPDSVGLRLHSPGLYVATANADDDGGGGDEDADGAAAADDWTICGKCCRRRPPLAHHCRRCGQCVRKMDHHCPWSVTQLYHQSFMCGSN